MSDSQASAIFGGGGNATAFLGSQQDPYAQQKSFTDLKIQQQDLVNKQQDNLNKQQELENAKTTNDTAQRALKEKASDDFARLAYGLSLKKDLTGQDAKDAVYHYALLNPGLLTPDMVTQFYQQIDSTPAGQLNGKLREFGTSRLPQKDLQDMTYTKGWFDNGLNKTPYVMSNPGGADTTNVGNPQWSGPVYQKFPEPEITDLGDVKRPTAGGLQVAPDMDKGIPPQILNTQGGHQPVVKGKASGPAIANTYTPEQASQLQERLVPDPDHPGKFIIQQKQLQQWNPSLAPAGSKAAPPGSALGTPGYPQPPEVTMPQGQGTQFATDQKLYNEDKAAVPTLQTGTQSLNKALIALNMVDTGAGTEGFARMRSYAVSLGNVVGLDTGGVNVQDMNRAQLEKYLTDYARLSATAGRSDAALEASFTSNASGHINNAASQDVVRTNIGRDRQRIAAVMLHEDETGGGYTKGKADYALKTDPRGFAWDTYTPQQQAAIKKEVEKNPEAQQKLIKAIGDAAKLKLLNGTAFTLPNQNAAPAESHPPPYSPPQTPSTGGALLGGQ